MMSVETTNEALETSHTLSASSVVKSLKSSNLSHEEKLELALKAWKSDTVLIPKKLEFLLDWCTNSMVKSTGWNDKTFGRTPSLSTHYWDFYHTLLHHAHSVTNSLYLVITALKTPLVPLYISTLSDFRNSLSNSQINENVEEWTSLLDRIHSSLLIILKESSGTRWTLDGLCSIVGEVLACLNVSVQKDRINSTLLEKECQIAIEVMKNLVTMIRSQANLKKTFNTVVTKFLKPIALFHLHIDSMKTPSKFVTAVQQQTSLVVQYGLFHIDHIPEYIQLFRPTFAKFLESNDKSSNSKSKSHPSGKDLSRYQKVLFESLKSNLPVENSDSKMDDEEDQWIASAVLNFIPKLYATFLSSFRSYVSHQQSKLTLSNGRDSSTMLINRAAPFALFCELRSIIYTNIDVQKTLLIDSSTSTDYLIQVLKTDNMLLDLVLEKNVYQDLNDSVAKWMRQYLLDISKESVDLMEAIWKLPSNNEFAHPLQSVVIQRWDILLRLNNSIVDPHLEPIFAKFVQAHPDCYDVIKTFLISAIQMYDRSRQFESFISTLLKCLHILSNKQDWDCHAIFDDSVLQKFGSVVATLPPLQTLSILSSFVDVTSSLMPPPSSKEVTKKRKLTQSLHVDVSNGSTTLFPVAVFFSWFLRHMRLSENQMSKLKVLSERAWSELISHLPTLLSAKFSDQVFNLITPLISLHVEWMESSVPYSDIITVDDPTLARTLVESFHSIIKSPEMVHPSIVATAIHAVVQYVAVFLRTRPVDANEYERLRVLMSDVFHASNIDKTANDDYPWSGKAWEISSDNMMTAWWMTIVRYFDIVCMFISEEISKKVAERVIRVLSGRNSELENWKFPQRQETLRSVTIKMLHAATFYELSPIRGPFFNALIQEIESRLISNKSGVLSTCETTIVPFIEALSLFPIEVMTKNEKETLFSIMIDFEKAYLGESEDTDLWDLCRAVERRSAGSHLLSLELFQWFTETTLSRCRILLASQSPSASVVSALESTAGIIKHFVLALINRLHQPTDTHISSFSRILENFCQLVQSSLNVEPPKDCNFSPDRVGVALLAPSLNAIMEWFETRAKKGNLQGDIQNAVLSNFDKIQQYTMTQISNYQNILIGDDEQAKNESIVNISHILPILNVIVRFARSGASKIQLPDLLPPVFSTIYTACSLSNENSNIKSVYPPLVAALCEYFNDIKETSSAISIGNMMDLILLWMDKCSYGNDTFAGPQLASSLGKLISNFSVDDYSLVIERLVDRLSSEEEKSIYITLCCIDVVVKTPVEGRKYSLRNNSVCILDRLSCTLASETCSKRVVTKVLQILDGLVTDKSLEFRTFEVSLILNGLNFVADPSFAMQMLKSGFAKEDACELFEVICQLLSNLLKHRRDEIVNMIPSFCWFLKNLLYSFRSTSPFHPTSSDDMTQYPPFPVLSLFSPLPLQQAQTLTRLYSTLLYKPTANGSSLSFPDNSKNKQNKLSTSTAALIKPFGKHVWNISTEYISIQTSSSSNFSKGGIFGQNQVISDVAIKRELAKGLYFVLDLCTEFERDMVLVSLDNAGKMLLKGLYNDYVKYHKYTGKV